jgi:membrane-bound lytic murein transglycosylase D
MPQVVQSAQRTAAFAVLLGALGCGGSRPALIDLEPARAAVPPKAQPVAVPVPVPTAEDSAADEAALTALSQLEFRGLGKRGVDLRGVLAAPTPGDSESVRLALGPRGGAASVSGPRFDIDVESFAAHDRVRYYEQYYLTTARRRFTIWLGRMHRYEGMVRVKFGAHGLPEDLAYLAFIESGYSNTAVSRARAVGMWQFMASTGRRYGLTVDAWVDERRDPFKATDAAARYLSDLYELFGSWYLAAAAYNGGEGRVSRGIRRLRGADSISDATFFDLSRRRYLRRETRDYVPKLIAAARIAKEPLEFGFDSIPYLQPLLYDEITVPDATGLDVLARLADTTLATLVELNPQYIRRVTPPSRPSIVRVPRGAGAKVARRYSELPPDKRVTFVYHRVRRGETLSGIGMRYGVSVRLLRAANNNVHPRRLRIGRRLIIPLNGTTRSTRRTASAPAKSSSGYHTVRRGESLWIISQRYNRPIADLRRWNGMRSGEVLLKVGQRLRIAP